MSVIERKTKETDIKAELDVYGSSKAEIDSGIGFFDHMLTALTVHGGFDLKLKCDGDLYVDGHHTVEDCGIDLTGGGIIELCEIFIYKSLVVTDIEVCLGAVIGDENLTVLIRIHRTRVNIEIRIQLHN